MSDEEVSIPEEVPAEETPVETPAEETAPEEAPAETSEEEAAEAPAEGARFQCYNVGKDETKPVGPTDHPSFTDVSGNPTCPTCGSTNVIPVDS